MTTGAAAHREAPPSHRKPGNIKARSGHSFTRSVLTGAPATGAKSSAPRCPAPDQAALRHKATATSTAKKSGKRHLSPAAGKCARPPPAPDCGASRAPSSETALTGHVRQRQAPAATRQPPRTAPATRRPRPRRPPDPAGDHGDRGTHGRPASRVARSAIAAGDATKERPLRETDGPRTIGSRFQGKPRKQPPPDKSAIARGQPSAQAPARPRPVVKPQVTGTPKPVSVSQSKVRNPRR